VPDAGLDDWDAHWSRYSEVATANPSHEYRRRLIARHLPRRAALRLLDVGSGQGDVSVGLAADRPEAVLAGIELSRVGVQIASERLPAAWFEQVDLLQDRRPPEGLERWAEAAVCSEVLEHLDEPSTLLAHLRDYLTDDAQLVVTVPAGPRNAYERHIGHRRHYTRRDLEHLLESSGYAVERVAAAGFPFFNLYKVLGWLRGERLVTDADAEQTRPPLIMRAALAAFRVLFWCNLPDTPWGWQLVAVARPVRPPSEG
jgi:trans-aconitate methyltransferase